MPVESESSPAMSASYSGSAEASVSSSGAHTAPPPAKKKRNLPGTPDPGAEVVALSPTTLMATNRFVCEVCGKGFQREQNLQLHRRGHNLPWKLRQRAGAERRRRVYVCPEPGCVHHDPARALGDLTGIKKHFSRKHGEKKWKCDKCSKKYAVQSDLKAHAKTCGTREYRCGCGTLFSRKDSFITHRTFCDTLAVENAREHNELPSPPSPQIPPTKEDGKAVDTLTEQHASPEAAVPPPPPQQPEPPEQQESANTAAPPPAVIAVDTCSSGVTASTSGTATASAAATTSLFACLFTSAAATRAPAQSTTAFSPLIGAGDSTRPALGIQPPFLGLSSERPTSLFAPRPPPPPAFPHLSATALLQKAAQMGSSSSTSSFLKEFGLATSSSEKPQQGTLHWHRDLEPVVPMLSAGLGLGLGLDYGVPDMMIEPSTLLEPKLPTLDFLGMGVAAAAAGGGLSALITSIGGGGLESGVGAGPSQGKPWERPEREPSSPAIL